MQLLGHRLIMATESWSGTLLLVTAPIWAESILSNALLGAGGIQVENMNLSGPELMGFSSWKISLILSITGLASGDNGPFGISSMPFPLYPALASIFSRG